MTINICISINSAYLRYAYVMLTSLFKNNKNNLVVYVLHKDLNIQDIDTLKELAAKWHQSVLFIKIDSRKFMGLPVTEQYKVEVYFRLMMPYVLPSSVEKVIHLDVDMIVRGSLENLFLLDLDNSQYIAACNDSTYRVLDKHRQKLFNRYEDIRYFNSGMMLWDLTKFRATYSFEDFKIAAKELDYDLPLPDQDLLNYMLYDKVKYISSDIYNCFVCNSHHPNAPASVKELDKENVILHFTGCPPWRASMKSELYNVWWDYAKCTPFYPLLLREQLERVEMYANQVDDLIYQRDLWRNAYKLTEVEKIEKYMVNSSLSFYIYGAGNMAYEFFKNLSPTIKKQKIKGVVDKNKKGNFNGIEIKADLLHVENNEKTCVVVTPIKGIYKLIANIRRQLPMADVISLKDFLYRCENWRVE